MCCRFALTVRPSVLQQEFDLGFVPPRLEPTDEYFPGKGIPAIVNALTRNVEILYWGLVPPWAKDLSIAKHTFNARCETLSVKPSFREAFIRRRCLIPATSYFEWKNVNGLNTPFRFSLKKERAFMLAGIWEYWIDAMGNELYSAAVITCPAGEGLGSYHERMPVIFNKENCWQWMEDRPLSEINELMQPIPAHFFEIVETK